MWVRTEVVNGFTGCTNGSDVSKDQATNLGVTGRPLSPWATDIYGQHSKQANQQLPVLILDHLWINGVLGLVWS